MADIVFTIRENRLDQSSKSGFTQQGDILYLDEYCARGSLFLTPLDSGTKGMEWGRFHADVVMDERRAFFIYAFASDFKQLYSGERSVDLEKFLLAEDTNDMKKEQMLKRLSAKRFTQKDDVLLYGLRGRYLFLAVIVIGEGDFSISRMKLDSEGDVFLGLFPEMYRNRGDFFHRFISIFASCYHDTQDEIDALPQMLDPDIAPEKLLSVYGEWLGINLPEGAFEESVMRRLIKEAWQLNRMKGSKWAIERLMEIILQEKIILLEQNLVSHYNGNDVKLYDRYTPRDRYEVVILTRKNIDEDLRIHLYNILNQFKPIRSRIKLVQLTDNSILDDNSYLDMNATIFEGKEASVGGGELDGGMILKE